MLILQPFNGHVVYRRIEALTALLREAVEQGAPVGFVMPIDIDEMMHYWHAVAQDLHKTKRLMVGAFKDGKLVGTAQLVMDYQRSAAHRAEITKVLVLTQYRRQGVAKALVERLELEAKNLGRTTLFLETTVGSDAEFLCQALDYKLVGSIPNFVRVSFGRYADSAIYYKALV